VNRPAGVPPDAVWNAGDNEWELGERRGAVQVGTWTWWRPDGSIVCRSVFDDGGKLDGIARRWHPNGEPSLIAPYVRGKLHGKQIATRPSTGDSPEMRELLALDDVFRSEMLYLDGAAQQGVTTLYGRDGLFDPIACDAEGKPKDLDKQLDKLRAGTALELLTPFLPAMGGDVPRSKITGLHYICAAIVGGAIHRVAVTGRRGEQTVAIVPVTAFAAGVALAVDLKLANLGLA
jgi:hypothetical protein